MPTRNCSDNELVKQFILGEQKSIEQLINRYKDRIYTYIYFNVKNQHLAEDIFQDTFIKVIQSLKAGKYKDEGRLASWITRIAHNLIIDHYRKEKNFQTLSNDEGEMEIFNSRKLADESFEEDIVMDQITQDVRKLIDYLPDDQKEVVVLRHFVGLSFKEIAEQTNVSINTALGRMRYALINLRRLIEEKNICLTKN